MATDPVVKEIGQLWRLSQYTWQQKQGRLLLLSSLLISVTVMWCMASSVLPMRTSSSQTSELIALSSPVQLTMLPQSLAAEEAPITLHQKLDAKTGSALEQPSEALSMTSSPTHEESLETSRVAAVHDTHAELTQHDSADVAAEQHPHRRLLQAGSIAQTVNPRLAKTGASKTARAHHPHSSPAGAAAAATADAHESSAIRNVSSDVAIRLEASDKLSGMVATSSRAFRKAGKFAVTRDDLVAAIPTDLRNRALVDGSKSWRKDMRTYLAINNSYVLLDKPVASTDTELWRAWRDDNETWATYWCQPWDARIALTPFLAHGDFHGDYKWMLFGHDDTFFFVNNVLELLQDFDSDLPYVISDHFWWTNEPIESADVEKDFYHPSEFAPHCMPCHWGQEEEQTAVQGRAGDMYQPFQPYTGCPCTLQGICERDKRGMFKTSCNKPLKPLPVRLQLGAGVLLSKGFLEAVPLGFMEQCILDLPSAPGANGLFSHCIQQAGYGFTNPGHSFYHWDAKSFDPGPNGSQMLIQAFHDASAGAADELSKEQVSHVISSHIEGQVAKGAAHTMLQLQSTYDRWRSTLLETGR